MICITISTLALLVACEIHGESPYLTGPMIRAAVSGGQVFVSPNPASRDAPDWSGSENTNLVYQNLSGISNSVAHIYPGKRGNPFPEIQHRWHIDKSRFLCIGYSEFGNSGLEAYRRQMIISIEQLDVIKKLNGQVMVYPKTPRPETDQSSGTWHEAGPFGWQTATMLQLDTWNYRSVYFDFLPIADGQFEWYVTAPGPKGTTTRQTTRWVSKRPTEKGEKPKWMETGLWTHNYFGEFYVHANGADRYFVTGQTNGILKAAGDAKPGAGLKEVWKGPPVAVLIHDADVGKSYAFTKDEYFEIADPIKPKPHSVSIRFPVRRAWDAHKALDTAIRCERVVRGLPEPPNAKPPMPILPEPK